LKKEGCITVSFVMGVQVRKEVSNVSKSRNVNNLGLIDSNPQPKTNAPANSSYAKVGATNRWALLLESNSSTTLKYFQP